MAKKKIKAEFFSFGIYHDWDASAKSVPKIKKYTQIVPAIIDVEFGFVLKISSAKGKQLDYKIEHPPFKDRHGNKMGDFIGHVKIKTNQYDFYLGDTIWQPIENKCGEWILSCSIDNKELARKVFTIVRDSS